MPLRRYIFNTLTVVSLLLMLATVGLWVRSKFATDYIDYMADSKGQDYWDNRRIISGNGILAIRYWRQKQLGPHDGYFIWNVVDPSDLRESRKDTWLFKIGFSFEYSRTTYKEIHLNTTFVTSIPHWFLTLIFTILPAIWLFKWNKRRKLGVNVCPSCGYDLTGNESGVCSECGVKAGTSSDSA
jgi:hypothetical protein